MKRSNSFHRNAFSDTTRSLFFFNDAGCWLCGANQTEGDHITGRRLKHQASPYNFAPLCRSCHSTKKKSDIPLLLHLTAEYLKEQAIGPMSEMRSSYSTQSNINQKYDNSTTNHHITKARVKI